jgi:hypothetical protein
MYCPLEVIPHRRSYLRSIAFVAVIAVLLTACATDVTTSDEYLALETERDEATAAQAEAEQKLADTESELEASQQDLADAEQRAGDAEAQVLELEGTLEEEINRIDPYPPAMVDLFVEGCAEGAPGMLETCVCAIDGIQDVMPFAQFLEVSVAFFDAPLDPVTGFPADDALAGIPGAELFFGVFIDCLFS